MTIPRALAGALALACLIAGPAAAQDGDAAAPYAMYAATPQRQPTARFGRLARLHGHSHVLRHRLHGRARGDMLRGVMPALAAKARAIVAACGSHVVSGVRHTRVAGSGRLSLHASGRAVDLRGNPGCIYAHLRGWPGGYSTDYARAPGGAHVHVSLGGREHGLRFAHHQTRRVRIAWR